MFYKILNLDLRGLPLKPPSGSPLQVIFLGSANTSLFSNMSCKSNPRTYQISFLMSKWEVVRSCRLEVFCGKGVLRSFTKFTGKDLRQRLFFNKVAGLRPATLLKKSLWHRSFPVNFRKFLKTPFFAEHLRWLLLTHDH